MELRFAYDPPTPEVQFPLGSRAPHYVRMPLSQSVPFDTLVVPLRVAVPAFPEPFSSYVL